MKSVVGLHESYMNCSELCLTLIWKPVQSPWCKNLQLEGSLWRKTTQILWQLLSAGSPYKWPRHGKTALEIQLTSKIAVSLDCINNFLDTADKFFSQLFHYLFSALLLLWMLEVAGFLFFFKSCDLYLQQNSWNWGFHVVLKLGENTVTILATTILLSWGFFAIQSIKREETNNIILLAQDRNFFWCTVLLITVFQFHTRRTSSCCEFLPSLFSHSWKLSHNSSSTSTGRG